jgi:hypothetical protein
MTAIRLVWIVAIVLLAVLTVLGLTVMADAQWWPYVIVITVTVVIVVIALLMRGKRGGPEASAPLGPVKGTESASTPPAVMVE